MSPTALSPSEDALTELALAGARRFTLEQYHKMLETGIFMDGDRVELIEGYILEKHVRNPPHESSLRRLTNRFGRYLPATGWCLQIQGAVTLPGESEPEPDGVVLRGADSDFDGRLPGASDIGLAVEVSDTSRGFDRRVKGLAYARAAIPVYWVINVADRVVEVYTDPDPAASPPAYRTRTEYRPGQDLPIVLDGAAAGAIPVSELIP